MLISCTLRASGCLCQFLRKLCWDIVFTHPVRRWCQILFLQTFPRYWINENIPDRRTTQKHKLALAVACIKMREEGRERRKTKPKRSGGRTGSQKEGMKKREKRRRQKETDASISEGKYRENKTKCTKARRCPSMTNNAPFTICLTAVMCWGLKLRSTWKKPPHYQAPNILLPSMHVRLTRYASIRCQSSVNFCNEKKVISPPPSLQRPDTPLLIKNIIFPLHFDEMHWGG